MTTRMHSIDHGAVRHRLCTTNCDRVMSQWTRRLATPPSPSRPASLFPPRPRLYHLNNNTNYLQCNGTIDPEALTDRSVPISELQRKLQVAVDSEDYVVAAQLRDEIERRRFDTRLAIEEANDAFYQAFESGSYKAMAAVWGEGEHVQCIHPGSGCIAGSEAVLESWKVILGSARVKIQLHDVRIYATETEGYVTCVEVMDAGDSKGKIVATNVFERQQGGGWKIVHHHGSRLPGLRG